jgi:L-asparaginase
VDLVAAHPGADSTLLRASLAAGAAGIVVQATGIGNANQQMLTGIVEAITAGVMVVTSTRVDAGPVVPRYGDGGGEELRVAGAIPSGLLRPSQSLILLSLLLRLNAPRVEVEEAFTRRGRPS